MAAGGNTPDSASDPAVCPVDHKTRNVWLEQARAQAQAQTPSQNSTESVPAAAIAKPASSQPAPKPGFLGSWSSLWVAPSPPHSPLSSQGPSASTAPSTTSLSGGLGTGRVVSTIPRTTTTSPDDGTGLAAPASSTSTSWPSTSAGAAAARPVNHEVETGADPVSGNWVYPSEKMFFDAMKRKGNDNARVADMRVVVPIHNAVNERAWKEILEWEAPYNREAAGPNQCGGPRLHSFAGLSTSMSPKARFNTLLGYSAPFDRHDWVVDRCGTQIEYVIDFYAGRPGQAKSSSSTNSSQPGQQPQISFYLDVRPKLNSWEGIKMRTLRGLGLQ